MLEVRGVRFGLSQHKETFKLLLWNGRCRGSELGWYWLL